MTRPHLISILSVLILMTAPLPAQDAFTRAVQVHGADAITATRSIRLNGTVTRRDGTEEPVVISGDINGSVRTDYGGPLGGRTVVRTPESSFTMDVDGEIMGRPAHVDLFAELDVFAILALRRFDGSDVDTEPLAERTVHGRPSTQWRIRSDQQQAFYGRTLANDAEMDFDVETGLLTAITRTQYADRSFDLSFQLIHTFSDYRIVSGLQVPHRIEKWIDNVRVEVFVIDSVELNPSLLDFSAEGGR